MSGPIRDRPAMPSGYGIEAATGYLDWAEIEARLTASTEYWVATTRPDGRPHVVPRWGVWLDGRFWYDGSPETVHYRNAEMDPRCVLHLESGVAATVVEGSSVVPDPIVGLLGERLASVYAAKYGPQYVPQPDQWSDSGAGGMRTLIPHKIIAWTDFATDPTRFVFTEEQP